MITEENKRRLDDLLTPPPAKTIGFYRAGFWVLLIGNIFWPFYALSEKFFAETPDDFMVVTNLFVPNHKAGTDPGVLYSRMIKQNFRAQWLVELRDAKTDLRVDHCKTGNGIDSYEPGIFTSPMKLRFYAGWRVPDDCPIPNGCFYLLTSWHILDLTTPSFPPVQNRSNKFCVS